MGHDLPVNGGDPPCSCHRRRRWHGTQPLHIRLPRKDEGLNSLWKNALGQMQFGFVIGARRTYPRIPPLALGYTCRSRWATYPVFADVRLMKHLFNFKDPIAAAAWHPIDDRVMGGLSRSALRSDPAGHSVFAGEVSLEQNGGFASVRSTPGDRGQAGATACLMEVRGDNKQFKLSLLTDDGFDSLNYQAGFTPAGQDWQTLHLPLTAFRASFRGREVVGAPPLDPARIRQVGLMIAARQAGPFNLDIRWISLS